MHQKLADIVLELFAMEKDEITEEMSMKDMDAWDSLKHMELVVSIEQLFQIELTFDEIVSMQTLKEIERILKERGIKD
jgi:acyl carrier protein